LVLLFIISHEIISPLGNLKNDVTCSENKK
jgi:hypothetical protein